MRSEKGAKISQVGESGRDRDREREQAGRQIWPDTLRKGEREIISPDIIWSKGGREREGEK